LNPRLADEEREHIIGSSGAATLVVDATFEPFVEAARSRLPRLRTVVTVDGEPGDTHAYETLLAKASSRPPSISVAPDAPSFILYTSGTTGRPKGATASVRGRVAATTNMLLDELDVTPDDVMIHAGPLSHGSGSKILAYWVRGAANLVVRRFDPEQFLSLVGRGKGTSSFLVPTMIAMLVATLDRSRHDLRRLRTLTYGGAPIAPERLAEALEAFGPVFVQVYGSCEAPHPVLVLGKREHVVTPATAHRLGSAGRPVLRVETRIVARDGADTDEGELRVRGENVMLGYWSDPVATEEVLGDGWYRTGDVARRDDDGFLYLIDRERDLVISGGLNVYPAEVEAALLRHPAVAEVAVIGVPDPVWGEAVKALVVRASGAATSEAELLEHCRTVLAGYKKPRSIEFVASLPRGSTGKILKRELRRRYWSGEARQVH